MQYDYVKLTFLQVGLAALLILINGAISLALRLGLEFRLLIAAARMVVQLLLVGLVLLWVFELKSPAAVLLIGLLMAFIAGVSAVGRVQHKRPGIGIERSGRLIEQ